MMNNNPFLRWDDRLFETDAARVELPDDAHLTPFSETTTFCKLGRESSGV